MYTDSLLRYNINFKFVSFKSFYFDHLIDYPTHSNLNYLWGFGSMAGILLVIQILTGMLLGMYYVPNISLAFYSVEYIMRDINYGWLIRYLHSNGASFFFIFVYLHIGRGLYFNSYNYPHQYTWFIGILIFILMIITAFLGYVLPWGQMSLWGATVITNLLSAIPIIGMTILEWLWGGFSVENPTLKRFAILHYYLPLLLIILVFFHLSFLHNKGSTNPIIGKTNLIDAISFTPYYYLKDLFGFFSFSFFFSFFLFFFPNFLGHSDNYIEANPLITPSHIVPEWYLLPFYAILRSIPNKLFGVIFMLLALLFLMFLFFFDFNYKNSIKILKNNYFLIFL